MLLSGSANVNATDFKESNAYADEESQRALAKSRPDGRLAVGPRAERGGPLTQAPIQAMASGGTEPGQQPEPAERALDHRGERHRPEGKMGVYDGWRRLCDSHRGW